MSTPSPSDESTRSPIPATLRLGLLLAVVAAILVVGLARLRAPRGPEVVGMLRDGRGLRVGAPVLFRGLNVGTVTAMDLTDTGIRVTFVLQREDVPLREEDGIRVQTLGLLGDASVELVPGPRAAAAYVPGHLLGEAPPDSAMLRQRAAVESAFARLVAPVPDSVRGRRDSVGGRP